MPRLGKCNPAGRPAIHGRELNLIYAGIAQPGERRIRNAVMRVRFSLPDPIFSAQALLAMYGPGMAENPVRFRSADPTETFFGSLVLSFTRSWDRNQGTNEPVND